MWQSKFLEEICKRCCMSTLILWTCWSGAVQLVAKARTILWISIWLLSLTISHGCYLWPYPIKTTSYLDVWDNHCRTRFVSKDYCLLCIRPTTCCSALSSKSSWNTAFVAWPLWHWRFHRFWPKLAFSNSIISILIVNGAIHFWP